MKELQRLVHIIDKHSSNSLPLINFQDESTLEFKLFNLLKKNQVPSEETVAEELYGSKKLSGSYRTLKSRFRKKLYKHLHFLDHNVDNLESANHSFYACLSILTEAQALMMHSEYKPALKLFEQVMRISDRYENNEMRIKALEGIRDINHVLSKFDDHAENVVALEEYYQVQSCERQSVMIYDKAILTLRGHVSLKPILLEQFPTLLSELWGLWEKSNSSRIFFHHHMLQIAYLEQIGNYARIVDAIGQTEKLVKANRVNTSWYNRKYNSYIVIYALLQSRQYEKGLRLAAENIKSFVKYSANWFAFMENYVLLAMHSKQYKLAENLLKEVIEGEHLRKLGDSSIERWELYRRYFAFVVEQVREEQLQALSTGITTRLLILPNDKVGFNLALLVLDVLEKLAAPHVEDLALHAERVRKYTSKHLKGEKAERPRLFLRLLLLVLTKSSTEARVQGEELLEKLKATPLPGDAFTEVEIVPYEHLWELAVQLLKRREQLL